MMDYQTSEEKYIKLIQAICKMECSLLLYLEAITSLSRGMQQRNIHSGDIVDFIITSLRNITEFESLIYKKTLDTFDHTCLELIKTSLPDLYTKREQHSKAMENRLFQIQRQTTSIPISTWRKRKIQSYIYDILYYEKSINQFINFAVKRHKNNDPTNVWLVKGVHIKKKNEAT
jgi:hypothetical protein